MMILRLATDYKLYAPLLSSLTFFNPVSLLAADDELFFEMPVVLSATRLEQPISNAAVSVSVIDRETIEASGARTIPEVLRLVPGMQVAYSGNEFGEEPQYVVAYHGHSDQNSKQMQVLIDGRSIYEPLIGGILWKSIPINIDNIERIEVSRGPNPSGYGSNTFMAAINIITRTAAEDQGSYIRVNAGNHDIADLTYRYGGSSGKLDYRLTLSTFNDDGLDSANSFDYPDDSNSDNIDYRLDYQIDNNNSLSYQGGYGKQQQQADRNHEAPLPTGRTIENTRFFQFIKLESAINKENTILLQYYYNLSDKDNRYITDPISFPPFDTFSLSVDGAIKAERHNLEFSHQIYPDDNLKLVWGLNTQLDYVQAPVFLATDEKVSNRWYRGFANIEWAVNRKNTINIGGLVEKNDFSTTELSPRLSLTHALNERHKIRFGISQAYRSPFIFEAEGFLGFSQELTVAGQPTGLTALDLFVAGNTELENEEIISREIAYFGEFLKGGLLFNARLFYDSISDFVTALRQDVNDPSIDNVDNSTRIYTNVLSSTSTGLELELNYRIDASLRLIASGAIINIQSDNLALTLSAPQHSLSLMAIKRFNEQYNASIAYFYVDEFNWIDARGNDDYDTLDLRLSRNFTIGKSHNSLSLVLKNLLGDYGDYNSEPRNPTAPQVVNNTLAYLEFRSSF